MFDFIYLFIFYCDFSVYLAIHILLASGRNRRIGTKKERRMKLFTLIILLVCDGIYISSNSALLLPYGESIGDTSLGDGDNEAVLFHLQNKIKLWDKEFEELYVSYLAS